MERIMVISWEFSHRLGARVRRGYGSVMNRRLWALIVSYTFVMLAGCEKSLDVGGGYKITAPSNPDGQYHGNSLYYGDKKIWQNVAMQHLHEGILVFHASVRDSMDAQFFAARGSG